MRFILTALLVTVFARPILANSLNRDSLKAIADDLDNLVGDTVDEGSWDANVIRDREGYPTLTSCTLETTRRGDKYSCDITFLVTPYEGEDIESEPWEVTCSGVKYLVKIRPNLSLQVVGEKDSLMSCIELLGEGP